jgi:hypothetical protein
MSAAALEIPGQIPAHRIGPHGAKRETPQRCLQAEPIPVLGEFEFFKSDVVPPRGTTHSAAP